MRMNFKLNKSLIYLKSSCRDPVNKIKYFSVYVF